VSRFSLHILTASLTHRPQLLACPHNQRPDITYRIQDCIALVVHTGNCIPRAICGQFDQQQERMTLQHNQCRTISGVLRFFVVA
jgi:hypothetical protein